MFEYSNFLTKDAQTKNRLVCNVQIKTYWFIPFEYSNCNLSIVTVNLFTRIILETITVNNFIFN